MDAICIIIIRVVYDTKIHERCAPTTWFNLSSAPRIVHKHSILASRFCDIDVDNFCLFFAFDRICWAKCIRMIVMRYVVRWRLNRISFYILFARILFPFFFFYFNEMSEWFCSFWPPPPFVRLLSLFCNLSWYFAWIVAFHLSCQTEALHWTRVYQMRWKQKHKTYFAFCHHTNTTDYVYDHLRYAPPQNENKTSTERGNDFFLKKRTSFDSFITFKKYWITW